MEPHSTVAPGKRQREGDQLLGRHPEEELHLQSLCADGGAFSGVSWMESGRLVTPTMQREGGMGTGSLTHLFQ